MAGWDEVLPNGRKKSQSRVGEGLFLIVSPLRFKKCGPGAFKGL